MTARALFGARILSYLPNNADTLEYFAVLIEGGPMSARFAAMKEGDTILLDKTATGFLLPERFPDGKDLVMLCTGSGIAPFPFHYRAT